MRECYRAVADMDALGHLIRGSNQTARPPRLLPDGPRALHGIDPQQFAQPPSLGAPGVKALIDGALAEHDFLDFDEPYRLVR